MSAPSTQPTPDASDDFVATESARTAPSLKTQGLVVAILVVSVVAFGALRAIGPQGNGASAPLVEGQAVQGDWFCPAGDPAGDGGVHLTTVAVPDRGGSQQDLAVWAPPPVQPASSLLSGVVTSDAEIAPSEDAEPTPDVSETEASREPVAATITVQREGAADGDESPVFPLSVRGGSGLALRVEAEGEIGGIGPVGRSVSGTGLSWRGQPAVVGRLWRPPIGAGTRAVVAGTCLSRPSASWTIGGLTTRGSGQAQLWIANPFATPAAVDITLTTDTGLTAPQALQSVSIRPGTTLVIDLADHAPAFSAVGATIEATVGRTVVEAVQSVDAAIGGVDGISIVHASARPSVELTFPFALQWGTGLSQVGRSVEDAAPVLERADLDTQDPLAATVSDLLALDGLSLAAASWVWITNPSAEDAASVTITGHGTSGPVALSAPGILIPPSTTTRLPIPSDFMGGLSVRSDNDQPVYASVGVAVSSSASSGWSHVAAQNPANEWVIPTVADDNPTTAVWLVNPSGSDVEVTVTAFDEQGLRPAETVTLPAGVTRTVAIADQRDVGQDGVTVGSSVRGVWVQATGPGVVAAAVAADVDLKNELANIRTIRGAASDEWTGSVEAEGVRRDPRILRVEPTTDDPLAIASTG